MCQRIVRRNSCILKVFNSKIGCNFGQTIGGSFYDSLDATNDLWAFHLRNAIFTFNIEMCDFLYFFRQFGVNVE